MNQHITMSPRIKLLPGLKQTKQLNSLIEQSNFTST